jgi:hypothetical protein
MVKAQGYGTYTGKLKLIARVELTQILCHLSPTFGQTSEQSEFSNIV